MQVIFYTKPKQNKAKSAEAGQPVFDEVEMADVRTGDRNFNPHFPAHEPSVTWDARRAEDDRRTWAERFPAEYRAFKEGYASSVDGMPLSEWPILSRAKLSELTALGFSTVEQLAACSDRNRAQLGAGARQLIAQAQAHVESARSNAPVDRLAAENIELRDAMTAMREEMAALRASQAPRRGRPKKEAEAEEEAAPEAETE